MADEVKLDGALVPPHGPDAAGASPDDRSRWGLSDRLRSISGSLQALPTGARARLRRMDPESPGREIGDVIALLIAASVPAQDWQDRTRLGASREAADDRLMRWARVCHLMATLAGAAGREVHAPARDGRDGRPAADFHAARKVGEAIYASGLSELRLMRLTSARGSALSDQVRRLARYLASAGALPLDLTPVAGMILHDGLDERSADAARLDIAQSYYAAAHRTGTKGPP